MSLTNKVVLITGGGSGIGADAAKAFHSAGAKIVLNGRREDALQNTAAHIDPSGKNVAFFAGDIGNPNTSRQIVALATKQFGGVDILLNNAGIFKPKPFLEHTEQDLNGYMNLLRGYFFIDRKSVV